MTGAQITTASQGIFKIEPFECADLVVTFERISYMFHTSNPVLL